MNKVPYLSLKTAMAVAAKEKVPADAVVCILDEYLEEFNSRFVTVIFTSSKGTLVYTTTVVEQLYE